jgi:hypothetical protein
MNNPLRIFPSATASQNPSRNAPRMVSGAMWVLGDYREGVQAK